MTGRLSTCAVCGGTIRWDAVLGRYVHTNGVNTGSHRAEPDDGAISPPDEDDEAERALDEDANAYHERMRD